MLTEPAPAGKGGRIADDIRGVLKSMPRGQLGASMAKLDSAVL